MTLWDEMRTAGYQETEQPDFTGRDTEPSTVEGFTLERVEDGWVIWNPLGWLVHASDHHQTVFPTVEVAEAHAVLNREVQFAAFKERQDDET